MTEPREPTGITLADVIVASGATEAPLDQDRFYEALELHREHMSSEEELLRGRSRIDERVSFRIKPNESLGRPLIARLVEGDASVESTIGSGDEVGIGDPFVAQRYKNYFGKSQQGHEGGLEFAGGFEVMNDQHGVIKGLVRKRVVSVALRNLGGVDITESRGGVIVARWANGQLLIPGVEGAQSGEPETGQKPELEKPEPARERIELRSRPEAVVEPEKVVRFDKACVPMSPERARSVGIWLEGLQQRIEDVASRETVVAQDKDTMLTDMKYFTTATTRGHNDDGIVFISGIPARVSYEAEEDVALRRQGSVLTIVLNPEVAEPEILEFDFEGPDPAAEIVRLSQSMIIDGKPVEYKEAEPQVIRLIAEAGSALIDRR